MCVFNQSVIQLRWALIKTEVEYSVVLGKRFIWLSVSPWGALVLLVKKSNGLGAEQELQWILGSKIWIGSSVGCDHSEMLSVDEWTSFV